MTKFGASLTVALLNIACGGAVETAATETSPDSSQGTSGSSSSSAGGAMSGGQSGISGEGGSKIFQGGGDNCAQTDDAATIDVSGIANGLDASGQRSDVDVTLDGWVASLQTDSFILDGCSPNAADCTTTPVRVTINAPGLDLTAVLTVGALASVHFARSCPWGCTHDIVVTSLATWQNILNPSPANAGIYVAANNGGGTIDGVPYQLDRVQLSCPFDMSGGCSDAPGLYLLRFSAPSTGESVDVHMGETQSLRVNVGRVRVRNLRSYVTGWCDDDWRWGHWVANEPAPPS